MTTQDIIMIKAMKEALTCVILGPYSHEQIYQVFSELLTN